MFFRTKNSYFWKIMYFLPKMSSFLEQKACFFFRKCGVFLLKNNHFWKFCFGYCLQNFCSDFRKKCFLFFCFFTLFENPLIIVIFLQEFWRILRFWCISQRSFTKSKKLKMLIYDGQWPPKLPFRTLFSLFSKKVFQNDQKDKNPFKNTFFFLKKLEFRSFCQHFPRFFSRGKCLRFSHRCSNLSI